MTSKVDQKSYLQKYLGGPSSDKKKKKKKVSKGGGFKIIDDDLDLTKLRPLDGDELDILDQGEDGPQIAGIIDERPEEVRKLEQFKTSSKWRVVNQDDGFSSKLEIEEIKKDIKEAQKENELVFGKMYSDSEDEKQNDSDLSPPRIKPNNKSNNREIKKKRQNNSDSDLSPQIRGRDSPRKGNRNDDSDISPPRKNINSKGAKSRKPSRWADPDPIESVKKRRSKSPSPKRLKHREFSHNQRKSKSPDSDISPPRKSRKEQYTPQSSRQEYNKRNKSPDILRKRRKSPEQSYSKYKDRHSGSERNDQRGRDNSKQQRNSDDSYLSPPRKNQKKDESPPKHTASERNPHEGRENTKQQRNSDDSDLSPPRKNKRKDESFLKHTASERNHHRGRENTKQQRNSDDSDLSPPRKNKRKSASPQRKPKKYHKDKSTNRRDSSSDLSPPRKDRSRNYIRSDNSPPPTNKKMEKTLDGKMAGLQDARQLREENEAFRKREDDAFNKMADEVSGRNAKAVSRKASKRETSEERKKQQEKAERQKELDEKYKKWSKGLKQIEAQEARMQDFVHEAAKPLARHKNDRDLENSLKEVLRHGDPMLRYITDKKRERGELGPEKPMYKGNFPPNRFNIRPGYRWDGVDRSNGYEKKFFDQQSKRKAQEEDAYKWSTEDL